MPNEARHTPGPWVLTSQEGPDRHGVETFSVCADDSPAGLAVEGDGAHQCIATVRGATDDQAHANARLIAAAPDLLAALKDWQNYDLSLEGRQNRAHAAIARAEGREP